MSTLTPSSEDSDNPDALSELTSSQTGTTLDGRFRLDAAIGQGAMGTVFAATQLSVSRRVAVKLLREHIAEVGRARFLREAKVISAMTHPNIVQLVDFGEHTDGTLYLVMEYVEGIRMSRLLRKRRLHPNLALEIAAQICGALAEAHSHGIVHRDLKPSNMLVVRRADGSIQVKVLDFGVAYTHEASPDLTVAGALCGTPAYMAPEQARAHRATPAADLYALGLNLYEMIAGFRPFTGSSAFEIVMAQIHKRPPSLRPFVEEGTLPAPVVRIVEELLAKEPDQRPASASEVRQRLLRIRQELDWGPVMIEGEGDAGWEAWGSPRLGHHGGRSLVRDGASGESATHTDVVAARMPLPPVDRSMNPPREGPTRSVTVRGISDGASADASVVESLPPSRHGGGWDAFHGLGTADGPAAGGGVIDPNLITASTETSASWAAPSDETARLVPDSAANEPEPEVMFQSLIETAGASYDSLYLEPSAGAQLPRLADVKDLVVERPVRQAAEESQEPRTPTSFLRLALVALLAFLVVSGIGLGYLSLRDSDQSAGAMIDEEPPQEQRAVEPATGEDEASPEESRQPRQRPNAKRKEAWRKPAEPIRLFDEVEEDDVTPRTIIIEEAK